MESQSTQNQSIPVPTSVTLMEHTSDPAIIRLDVRIAVPSELALNEITLRNVTVQLFRVLEGEPGDLIAKTGKSCRFSTKPIFLRLSLHPPLSHVKDPQFLIVTKVSYISITSGRFDVEFKLFKNQLLPHSAAGRKEGEEVEEGERNEEEEEEEEYDGYEAVSLAPPTIDSDISPPDIGDESLPQLPSFSPPPPPVDLSTPPQYFPAATDSSSFITPPPYA